MKAVFGIQRNGVNLCKVTSFFNLVDDASIYSSLTFDNYRRVISGVVRRRLVSGQEEEKDTASFVVFPISFDLTEQDRDVFHYNEKKE